VNSRLLIAVIEDHDALREATTEMLVHQGFAAIGVASAEDLDRAVFTRSPEIFVIDLNLPGEDGLSLAFRLRKSHPAVGIIITTARTHLNDRVRGYESGADIYLPKPVEPLELLAAIRSLGNRVVGLLAKEQRFSLDESNSVVLGPKGKAKLSLAEARLLNAFLNAPARTLHREEVWEIFSADGGMISVDSLQNRLSHLRKKLQNCGAEGETIQALRGTGYQLSLVLQR
jgi:DNA-binding response OmpR family regulator